MTNDLLFNSVLKTNLNEVEGGGESSDDWSKVSDYKNYSLRCLPNFLFIGASKCGTSSMRSHLVSHPGVRFVRRMQTGAEGAEVHRFDRWDFMFSNYLVEQALEWGHAPRVHNASDPVIHYTPHYLFDPAVPMRVKSFYHYSLKFLVMVRNPTTRAVSSYWFKRPNEKGGSVRDFQRSVACVSLRHIPTLLHHFSVVNTASLTLLSFLVIISDIYPYICLCSFTLCFCLYGIWWV